MSDLFGFIFGTALLNNLVLTSLVGLDLQVTASRRLNTAWLVGTALTCCLSLILPGIYLLDQLIIIPLQLQFLDLLIYVMFIIIIVMTLQKLMNALFPLMEQKINTITPLVLMNSVILAAILLQHELSYGFWGSFLFGLSTGIGFLLLLLQITFLRERIDNENIPQPFRGIPILLIAISILSMGLMGLSGL